MMLLSKIKITTAITAAALLVLTLAGAGLRQARTWADGEAPLDKNFRVTVHKVIHDECTKEETVDGPSRPEGEQWFTLAGHRPPAFIIPPMPGHEVLQLLSRLHLAA